MVSVIIPVYETEEYIGQCLDSVLNQTYSDTEIILVIAKGTDGSSEMCDQYVKKDDRIRVIQQTDVGAGAARNQGVAESKGEFICFVDSDDWVEPDYVEKLVEETTRNNADIVECDYYWGENGTERIGGNSPYAKISFETLRTLGAPACWKQMYRKCFWEREQLCFSNTVAEDLFLYSIMYRVCGRRSFLEEPLYHYRIRSGSFTDSAQKDVKKYNELFDLFEMLVKQYRKRKLGEKAFEELYREISPHATIRYRAIIPSIDKETAKFLKQSSNEFFCNSFSKDKSPFNRKVMTVGGYGVGRIANYLTADSIVDVRFGFSSLVPIMSKKTVGFRPQATNMYRQSMIDKEVQGVFLKQITETPPDLLILDFLEERHDLIKINNCYYTYSNALEGSTGIPANSEVIPRNSAEYDALWYEACDRLVSILNKTDNKCKIILVENYLSDHIGNIYHKEVKTNNLITETNKKLAGYYRYMNNSSDRVIMIRNGDIYDHLKYTDEKFEYGVLPEHYNEYYYWYVAKMIMDAV